MTSDRCPLPDCHLRKDEDFDDLFKHLHFYHSKEDLVKYILEH